MDIVELMLETSSEKLTFDADAFVKPPLKFATNPSQTFTLPDGTTFSSHIKTLLPRDCRNEWGIQFKLYVY